jgi:hypothetical protein
MEVLKNIFESLKEQLKNAWAAQQESALFIAIKEKFEELPPLAQKAVGWGSLAMVVLFVLLWAL